MPMRTLVAFSLAMSLSIAGSAFAQQDHLTCADFQHNPDGSWTPLTAMTVNAPDGQIEIGPGVSLAAGLPILGLDLAAKLDQNCK
jgi:hypothetical protein